LAAGDAKKAAPLLDRAASGFLGIEAAWEAAVTDVELADAMIRAGRTEEARERLGAAVPVLEGIDSVRELERARALLDQLG
jgi:hypothetical protein